MYQNVFLGMISVFFYSHISTSSASPNTTDREKRYLHERSSVTKLCVILLSSNPSTVSSSINALAAVTVEDLIKPHINVSEKHLSWASKGLSEQIVLTVFQLNDLFAEHLFGRPVSYFCLKVRMYD